MDKARIEVAEEGGVTAKASSKRKNPQDEQTENQSSSHKSADSQCLNDLCVQRREKLKKAQCVLACIETDNKMELQPLHDKIAKTKKLTAEKTKEL